jgi:hypothetical protein
MLPLSRPTLLIISLGAAILASSLPAVAQMSDDEIARRKASIRHTVGYTETVGWEKDLVERDANLGHWHWSPMVNYHQAFNHVPAGQSRKATQTVQRPQSIYIKPTKVALPQRKYDWSCLKKYQRQTARRRTTTDTSLVLTARQPDVGEAATVAKSYGSYGDVSGKIRCGRETLANREVSGRLLK